MKKIPYFAYGSNLNSAQMKIRCPDAVEVSPAVLEGWQLRERLYADIEPAPGECVNGALYEISPDDLAALDYYEGYPDFYTRKTVLVTDKAGVYRKALVYHMTAHCQDRRSERPYPAQYREVCSEGAEYWGIPNAFVPQDAGKNTLFPGEIPGVSEGIKTILNYLDGEQPLPRAKRLWNGGGVVITLKEQNIPGIFGFYPAPREITTRHGMELSWLFNDLRDLFRKEKILDSTSREDFFQELAETASAAIRNDPQTGARSLCREVTLKAQEIYEDMRQI